MLFDLFDLFDVERYLLCVVALVEFDAGVWAMAWVDPNHWVSTLCDLHQPSASDAWMLGCVLWAFGGNLLVEIRTAKRMEIQLWLTIFCLISLFVRRLKSGVPASLFKVVVYRKAREYTEY